MHDDRGSDVLVEAALQSVQDRLEQLMGERARLRSEFDEKLKPIEIQIRRLEAAQGLQKQALEALKSESAVVNSWPNGESPRKLTDVAEIVLKEFGKPMHYKAIADAIIKEGVYISAKDPGSFVIGYLRREPRRFCRTSIAGVYGLIEWELDDTRPIDVPTRGTKRTKRRKTSKRR